MTLLTRICKDLLLAENIGYHCHKLSPDVPFIAKVPLVLQRLCSATVSSNASIRDCTSLKRKEQSKKKTEKKSLQSDKNSLSVDTLTERRNLPSDVKKILTKHRNVLARTTTKSSGNYILEKTVANDIVKYLDVKKSKMGDIIFEANPGPGVVTQALLEAGGSTVRVFENKKTYIPYLQKLQNQYADRLEIVEDNFLDLSKIESRHRLSFETTMDTVFRGVQIADWAEAPPLKIFAVLPTTKELPFLRFILAKLPRFQSLFSLGRTQLFLFVSGKEYWSMTAKPNDKFVAYRSTSVLFQIFFDIKLLHKEPKESFFPPEAVKYVKQPKYDCRHMYLICLTPKHNLFDLVPPNLIMELAFFVRHHLMKRRRLICQSLEQWIPGCTSRLTEEGVDGDTMIGELTPEQILKLFLNFSSWPEYSDCLFRTAARKDVDDYPFNWAPNDVKEAIAENTDIPEEDILVR